MADTARTFTNLVTNLFQDGQADDSITPQDLRDLIISMQSEHGGIYVSTPASTSIAVAGTAVKGAGTTTLFGETANKFDMPTDNRLRYTGTPTRTVKVSANISVELDTAIVSKLLTAKIYKNGALITGAVNQAFAPATTAKPVQISVDAMVSLALNDYVEVWVANEDSTDNVTIQKMTLVAESRLA
jgi:hypothetical protein